MAVGNVKLMHFPFICSVSAGKLSSKQGFCEPGMNPAHPCVQETSHQINVKGTTRSSTTMASFRVGGDLALQLGGVASRYCLPNVLCSFERSTISILLDTGFPVFCRKLCVNGICIKLQHAVVINNWLEAELSHKSGKFL